MRYSLRFIVLGLAIFAPLAQAGKIQVVNENKKKLSVKIQAEGDRMNENLAEYDVMIPPEYLYEFFVTKADLKGKNIFSIRGDTSFFSPGGSCNDLSVDKAYKVVFKNDTLGTSCVATEVK